MKHSPIFWPGKMRFEVADNLCYESLCSVSILPLKQSSVCMCFVFDHLRAKNVQHFAILLVHLCEWCLEKQKQKKKKNVENDTHSRQVLL